MDDVAPGQARLRSARTRPRVHLREVRLVTGLVLGAFLLTHFGNHALGLISVDVMEAARSWFNRLWRHPIGTALLYGSVLVHFLLALHALYGRRTLRMPFREGLRLAVGLVLPFLLIPHVVGTRVELSLTGHDSGYPEVIESLWISSPESGIRQVAALVIAWLHGCLGIYFWLRPKPWFPRHALLLYTGAILVPVLALLGFAEAGKEIAAAPSRPAPVPEALPGSEYLPAIRTGLYATFGGLLAATLAARSVRLASTWSRRISITYPGGRVVAVPAGFSILEASRMAGIPHVSVCGGRGRCSTCRVRVVQGMNGQPAPGAQEQATLARIQAGPDVRLACQFRPVRDLAVVPVLSGGRDRLMQPGSNGRTARGQEREIAVLFCDLRGFTGLAEERLPFDTVFILNRYFELVGEAVEQAGGHVDKFVGDGALALFGLNTTVDEGARQALQAALRIREGVSRLNREFASELDHPLRIVMSLHAGPAIVGEMGYGQATSLTAVGDTLNAASRLEGLAKELDAELVISTDLARRAGLDLAGRRRMTVTVRGRAAPIDSWVIPYGDRIAPAPQ